MPASIPPAIQSFEKTSSRSVIRGVLGALSMALAAAYDWSRPRIYSDHSLTFLPILLLHPSLPPPAHPSPRAFSTLGRLTHGAFSGWRKNTPKLPSAFGDLLVSASSVLPDLTPRPGGLACRESCTTPPPVLLPTLHQCFCDMFEKDGLPGPMGP